jgi:dihydrofolate reductase
MKTILVDGINAFVYKGEGIFRPMQELLDKYPNRKIILTGANKEQMKEFGLIEMPYEVFTLNHNPEKTDPKYFEMMLAHFGLKPEDVIYFEHNKDAAKSAESVGIKTIFYDEKKKDLIALKKFLDDNLKPTISIIVGFPKSRVIGNGPNLPWHIPEDLKHFKEQTSGKTVIMGLVTFNSIGKPLPNRNNIVMSLEPMKIPGVEVALSINEAIEKAKKHNKDIFIIGGATIYGLFLPLVDKLYISHIKKEYEGNIFFPEYDTTQWISEHREDKGPFEFVIYKRKK